MSFDVLIKNALVIDGGGKPGFSGAVGISGKKISAVGSEIAGSEAKLIIDAGGQVLCPGFVDITNHSDTVGSLFLYPNQESMIAQGVTTIVGGNCGSSLAPLLNADVIQTLQKWRTQNIATVDWLSVGEFLHTVERLKPGVNFGTLVGLGTMRRGILNGQDKQFNSEDFLELKFLLSEAIKEGALGLSSGLVYAHESSVSTQELIDIASVLKKEGGIYKTHLRSESSALFSAVNEAITVAREADVPVSISHFKAIGRKSWREFHRALSLIEKASASGVKAHFDAYPYITTGSFLYLLLPVGAYEDGFGGLFKRLQNPDVRLEIIKKMQKRTLHYDSILIATAWKTKHSIGRSIKQVAESIGVVPEEAILELLLANEGRVTIFGHTVRREHVRLVLEHPLSMAASDGAGYSLKHRETGELVHPRSFGAFPRFFRLTAKKWKSLTTEEAIRRMTSAPAELVGIKSRGRIAKGYFADLVIFAPDKIQSLSAFENPYQFPYGIDYVLVNGAVAFKDGAHLYPRAGMVIKKGV